MNLSQMKYYKQLYGYSYEKLSELSGVPKGTIQKIFAGVTRSPRYDTLQALEKVLKSPEDSGVSYVEMMKSPENSGVSYVAEAAVVYGERKDGYTLNDYYALPEERRVELIDGVFYDMTSPTTIHQIIGFQMAYQLETYIEKEEGGCVPYVAPVDVQLDGDDCTMVQPDVIILCDGEKDIDRCIFGAPDFVAEVLSPSTRKKDMRIKTYKYANAGVREYWMIDPDSRKVFVYWFDQSKDDETGVAGKTDNIQIYGFQDQIPVQIFDGKLKIDFQKISQKLERRSSRRAE